MAAGKHRKRKKLFGSSVNWAGKTWGNTETMRQPHSHLQKHLSENAQQLRCILRGGKKNLSCKASGWNRVGEKQCTQVMLTTGLKCDRRDDLVWPRLIGGMTLSDPDLLRRWGKGWTTWHSDHNDSENKHKGGTGGQTLVPRNPVTMLGKSEAREAERGAMGMVLLLMKTTSTVCPLITEAGLISKHRWEGEMLKPGPDYLSWSSSCPISCRSATSWKIK